MGAADPTVPETVSRAGFMQRVRLWLRFELQTYRNLSVELPAFRHELQKSGASKSPWSEAAEALLKCAEHHLLVRQQAG